MTAVSDDVGAFARATAVRREADGRYRADLDGGWSVGGRPNGGYLLAVATRAALDGVDAPDPLAVSAHFVRPPQGGPAQVDVDVLHTGRTVSTVATRLTQGGRTCLSGLVTAGRLPEEEPAYDDISPPTLPPPESCFGGQPPWGRIELLDHVDLRLDPATLPVTADGELRPTGRPEVRGWLAFHDGADADELALLLATDALFPVVFNLGMFGWAPTVQLSFHLRGRPAPGWLRCRMRSRLVAGGWFEEDAEVWDSRDRLVAQARQLAMVGRG